MHIMSFGLQLSNNDLSQTANTIALGGNSVDGHGGDATATTNQNGAIFDNDSFVSGPEFPWHSSPAADVNLQVSDNTLTQTANTIALGGNSVHGDGGDATATTTQNGSISDNDSFHSSPSYYGPEYSPYHGSPLFSGPVADVDLQVSANTLTQFANTVAVGGNSVFGDAGDAHAMTNQNGFISDMDSMFS
jgi:hypothetical protein